jgi:flagellar motor switch/type III secretory pathway protein FliN
LPLAVTIAAKGVGEVAIRPDQLVFARVEDEVGLDGMDHFLLEHDGRRGWIGVGHHLSLALVYAALGRPTPAALRPLSRSERGVMAAILLSALDAIGVSQGVELGLKVSVARSDPATDRLVIGGSIHTATGLGGRALLAIPVGWLADTVRTGPVRARLEALAASATIELARTDLLGVAIASAAVGDAVVFEGVAGVEADRPWPACLRVGDFTAPAHLAADGTLAMVGIFSRVEEESKPMTSQDEDPRWTPTEPSSSEVAKVLATAPVEVVAEIGRLTLRGDELAGLMKGGVLSLGPRRTESIQLRVGGQPWATGELVSVGDELGVRILRLHAE